MDLLNLKGIGEKTASLFQKLHIENTDQLIHFFPRSYEYFEPASCLKDAAPGEICSIKAMILGRSFTNKHFRGISVQSFIARDENGLELRVTFFNMPYLKNTVKDGMIYIFRGILQVKGVSYVMEHPKMYKNDEYELLQDTLQPLYPLTKGLTNQTMKKSMEKALKAEEAHLTKDVLSFCFPDQRVHESYGFAVKQMHFPDTYELLEKARERLVFQEFFMFILKMRLLQGKTEREANHYPMIEVALTSRLLEKLPYKLTEDQNVVWNEIKEELSGDYTMSRLVQGDVGSGKTILAFLSMIMTVGNGYQAALMAPTEVLAKQHFDSLEEMTSKYDLPIRVCLLTGSVTTKNKKEIYQKIEEGEVDIVIGTHAVIQEKVAFRNLALVITDEQHRFGVKQRLAFSDKGKMPHILVMSATPIPRTLAMILYGDMDISVIHQMPVGRKPIKNCVVDTNYRKKAYDFIVKEVQNGHQAYIICPMVEEGEMEELENVTDYAKRLKKELPEAVRVSALHGKMKPAEKNRIMEEFAAKNIDVLVSTTVIEVGVNVPNSTVMLIENAERFGLAQLHQLRGRVGRGDAQGYCIFMSGSHKEETLTRLKILEKSNDGFEIAGEDMKRRGPGDLFGFRQSGEMFFALGDVYSDSDILKNAESEVTKLLKSDPDLSREEHLKLREYLNEGSENSVDFRTI